MIGQDYLVKKVNNINLDTLPRSLILLGDTGSGRHTLISLIENKINIPSIELTKNISKDVIDEIYLKVEPIIYVIDLDLISIKEENMILKLVEEPLKNTYIIFISKNKSSIIPTILNRCQVWELKNYSNEELRYFLTTKFDNYPEYFSLLELCDTPGQLLNAIELGANISEMKALCEKIIDCISIARFSNILTIPNKLSFDNENDKFNYDLFVKLLHKCIKNRIIKNYDYKLLNAYKIVNKLLVDNKIAHVNKKQLFENALYNLKFALG